MSNGGWMVRGGIGYDSVANDYKVVRVCRNSDPPNCTLETLIYSLKSNEWHRIADYAECVVDDDRRFGVFANGAINWIMVSTVSRPSVECIMALDLSSESYRQLPLPLEDDDNNLFDNRLDCLSECLLLSYSYAEKFDVWMMKDYDGESTWMKFVSLDKVYNVGFYLVRPKIVAYVESLNHVLIKNNNVAHPGQFLWFDVESKCGKTIVVDGLEYTSFQSFTPRHVRLPGSDGVQFSPTEGTLKRKRKSTNARLRLKLTTTDVCLSPEPRYLVDQIFA